MPTIKDTKQGQLLKNRAPEAPSIVKMSPNPAIVHIFLLKHFNLLKELKILFIFRDVLSRFSFFALLGYRFPIRVQAFLALALLGLANVFNVMSRAPGLKGVIRFVGCLGIYLFLTLIGLFLPIFALPSLFVKLLRVRSVSGHSLQILFLVLKYIRRGSFSVIGV